MATTGTEYKDLSVTSQALGKNIFGLSLSGDFVMCTDTEALDEALSALPPSAQVVLDISEVRKIDTTPIGRLAQTYNQLSGQIKLVAANRTPLVDLLTNTGLGARAEENGGKILQIYRTTDDAAAAFEQATPS